MIIEGLVTIVIALITAPLSLIPDLPPMPTALEDILGQMNAFMSTAGAILSAIYGQAFLTLCLVVIVALFAFENVYHLVMFILKKIPMINIH